MHFLMFSDCDPALFCSFVAKVKLLIDKIHR